MVGMSEPRAEYETRVSQGRKSSNSTAIERIAERGFARCKYCEYKATGDTFVAILEDLADHGEAEHPYYERIIQASEEAST